MENSSTSKVEGQGKVILKLTFGKELTLNNVLLSDGPFQLNVLTVVPKSTILIVKYLPFLISIVESFVWHGRLGHVNFNSLNKLINIT